MSQSSIFKHSGKIVMLTLITFAFGCNMPGAGGPQTPAFAPQKLPLNFKVKLEPPSPAAKSFRERTPRTAFGA